MRIRTVSVALGLTAVVVLTLLLAGLGRDTVTGAGTSPFGDGSDGSITFSTSAQFDPPVDAVVDSASGTSITVSSPSGTFLPGHQILIHQTRGTGAGTWELSEVQSFALGNITTASTLTSSYNTSGANAAQVLVLPQYTDLTVQAGVTISAKPWTGAKGGILAFLANGEARVEGVLSATGAGFRGGTGSVKANGQQGEGTPGVGSHDRTPNGNGGGSIESTLQGSGAGGGNGTAGQDSCCAQSTGLGGLTAGLADLSVAVFGGGAGGSSNNNGHGSGETAGNGGDGGGLIIIIGETITTTATGSIVSGGANGTAGSGSAWGGGGAGGSILLRGQDIALGTSPVTALKGAKGGPEGGDGGVGRIRAEFCNSISGGVADPPASIGQITSCKPTPAEAKSISITNVFQDPLPKSCFNVLDNVQTLLFKVCDNDFQGAPESHAACDDGNDDVCNDEDPAKGSVTVTVNQAVYHVEVGKVPLNITADATKGICSGGPTCELTFTNGTPCRPWYPWDVGTMEWPCDGIVDLPNDILDVILNYCPRVTLPCAKP